MYGKTYGKTGGWKRALRDCGDFCIDGACWLWDRIVDLLVIVIVVVIAIPFLLLEGYTVSKLWEWFVVPTFHTSELRVWIVSVFILIASVGIGLVRRAMGHVRKPPKKRGKLKGIIIAIAPWPLALGIGYVFHLFV